MIPLSPSKPQLVQDTNGVVIPAAPCPLLPLVQKFEYLPKYFVTKPVTDLRPD
jgi:hypothetical protein